MFYDEKDIDKDIIKCTAVFLDGIKPDLAASNCNVNS